MQFLQAVPNETSEFAEFQELAQVTADFETSLGRANLIPDWNETEGDKLRRFSSDVELHFAVKKRKQVVAKARNLLVASDYKTFLVIFLPKLVLGKMLFVFWLYLTSYCYRFCYDDALVLKASNCTS